MFRWWSKSVDGIDCYASLQRKTLILEGTSIFHSLYHDRCSVSVLDESPRPSSHASVRILVVTSIRLTENVPFGSWLQAQKSSTCLVHTDIDKIASASKGINMFRTSFLLQSPMSLCNMSSLTSCGGFLWQARDRPHIMISWKPIISSNLSFYAIAHSSN